MTDIDIDKLDNIKRAFNRDSKLSKEDTQFILNRVFSLLNEREALLTIVCYSVDKDRKDCMKMMEDYLNGSFHVQ